MSNVYEIIKNLISDKYRLSLIAAVLIILLVSTVFIVYCQSNPESDDGTFKSFADNELNQHRLYENGESGKVFYGYKYDISIAVRKTEIEQESISEYRDKKIQNIIDSCDGKTNEAIIIDSADFISDNGAVSFYITFREYAVKNRKPVLTDSGVKTYMFNGKTEDPIDKMQALRDNYKAPAAAFAPEYLKATYSQGELNSSYQQYIDDNDDNFNKFIIDGSEFLYFFDAGTVVNSSMGIVAMMVPEMFNNDCLREKIMDRYIDPDKPMVAVTYDDGPGGKAEMKILDTLHENGAVATFFYVGNRMSYSPETAQKAVEIGCELGNHSWDHPQYSLLSRKKIRKEINKTNKAIKKYTGTEPVIGRPPYGDYDDDTLKACNMPMVLWTIDTRDWATRNPKSIYRSVTKVKHLDGKIILMHSIYNETAKATEMIIPWLKEHGYQTVTVSELIKYKTGKKARKGKIYRKLN